ncbi:MAG: UDP-N-acetylmuramoyl-L-alanine--D-glutamate ligase [Mangrovibacterium sp.]
MAGKLIILGAGESGVGAAILAKKQGMEVFVSDSGKLKTQYRDELIKQDISFEEGRHSGHLILQAAEIIKSPGVPGNSPLLKQIRSAGIPVISEIEFAGRHTRAKTICITGSNGKTTTTMLIHHMLTKAGLKAGLAGNVGSSMARQVAAEEMDYYVIELSSFQLDDMHGFRADVAVLLNITPDHLDRYDYRMQNYTDAKFRIVQNQGPADFFIYGADDPVIRKELEIRKIPAVMLPFSLGKAAPDGAGIYSDKLIINRKQNYFTMSIFDLSLQGKHNLYNSMAAGLAGSVLNIRNETIRESLSDFKGVEHRLEHFLKVHGIEFVNDSKATNINSTWYALECINQPVVWIAGGVDKGNNYSELTELVREKVKAIVCLGVDNRKIVESFKEVVSDIVETCDMKDAVRSAYYLARDHDVVLLSPACASFDLFDNYEDRGRQFKQAVREL